MKIFIKVAIFSGLIDFTRQENLDLRNILMTSLREGRKFIDLFLPFDLCYVLRERKSNFKALKSRQL